MTAHDRKSRIGRTNFMVMVAVEYYLWREDTRYLTDKSITCT